MILLIKGEPLGGKGLTDVTTGVNLMKISSLVPDFMWYAFKSVVVQFRMKNTHANRVSDLHM